MTAAAVASGGLVVAAGGSDAMVSVLSTHQAPEGVPSQAVIEVPSELDPEQVRATLMASDAVEAVVQNRVVRITQDGAGGESIQGRHPGHARGLLCPCVCTPTPRAVCTLPARLLQC